MFTEQVATAQVCGVDIPDSHGSRTEPVMIRI